MADAAACRGRGERRRALWAERGYDAVILRNNPDLRWLTGAERTFDDEVAHTAVVTAGGLWLHTDSRYYNTFVERLGSESAWALDMEVTTPAAWAARRVAAERARVVAVEDTCDLAFYDDLLVELTRAGVACLTPRLHGDICDLRMVKDAEEVELMRRAQEVTDAAFEHICGWIRPGVTEQQIRVELENYMLSHGADELSFGSIIASGPNGANPHAQPGERQVQLGDLIVMDYGAGYHDYHSDMTRTVSVGEPSDEQRRVYDVVRRAHEESAAAVLEGTIAHNRETIQRVSSEMTESDTRAGSLAAQAAEQKEHAAELEGRIAEENAALEALLDYGRPRKVELLVLVDRGHRELPIHGDYVGRKINTARSEKVNVLMEERDGRDEVVLESADA